MIVKFFGVIFQILIFAQSLTFMLKLSDTVSWKWREVFWGTWILLAILAGEVLVLSLLSVTNCDILFNLRNYRRFTNDCRRCIFTITNWMASSSLLFVTVKLMVSLYTYLDGIKNSVDKDVHKENLQELNIFIYAIMGWLGAVFILIVICKKALM